MKTRNPSEESKSSKDSKSSRGSKLSKLNENRDSENAATKKGKAKLRKTSKPEEMDIQSTDKPIPIAQKVRGMRLVESTESDDTLHSSDLDLESVTSKQSSTKAKGSGNKFVKLERASISIDIEEEDPQTSDTEVKSEDEDDESGDSDVSSDSGIKYDLDKYKHSMRNLKSIDPDFYKFLQVHDAELLNFDEHEGGLDEKDDDKESEDVHVPDDKLHVDSDESDFEDDNAGPIKGKVTQQMISELNNELLKKDGKMKLSTIVLATKLFNGAVKRATSDDGNTEGEFKVAGSGVFNNIINMCVLYLPNGIKRYLGSEHSEKDPTKCKHFVKIKGTLVQYLTDLLKLLTVVTSENILVVMLKHLHQMAPYVACFVRIAKKAIKSILPLWSSGEETVRVLAFVCILRITRSQRPDFLEVVLKAIYMTYVKNCKFVSPSTWPGINFMRRSLVEMFLLNLDVTYPIAFVYIRQLGIHLRNAIMVPKKENTQAVYNWQYLNSLHLWAELIPQTMNQPQVATLIFPLTMIISNTIKMKPTTQYYPLRFYLTEILIHMTRDSGRFIPIQGYLMDVLTKFDFNKKHKKVSMKPLDFSCLIRLNKSQMSENGFKDAVVERLYALILEYTTEISNELSFPDVTMILLIHIKDFINKTTNPNDKRKFKQLYDKIEEGAEFIQELRFTNNMSLRDGDIVRAEQKRIKSEGTPLTAFYESWSKVNNIQKRKVVTKNEELAGEMPLIKRTKISEEGDVKIKDKSDQLITLFPSDSEDETDTFKNLLEDAITPKEKSKQKTKKKRNSKDSLIANGAERIDATDDIADAGDIVKEFSW